MQHRRSTRAAAAGAHRRTVAAGRHRAHAAPQGRHRVVDDPIERDRHLLVSVATVLAGTTGLIGATVTGAALISGPVDPAGFTPPTRAGRSEPTAQAPATLLAAGTPATPSTPGTPAPRPTVGRGQPPDAAPRVPAPRPSPAVRAAVPEQRKPSPRPRPRWVNPMPAGRVTSCYGQRWGQLHAGVDLAAPSGTPVRAVGAGRIVAAGAIYGGYGLSVLMSHGNGYLTHYAHLSAVSVRPGQAVDPGQKIGAEGSTGDSTGPHLHFEVHRGSWRHPIEPTGWLRERGVDVGCRD